MYEGFLDHLKVLPSSDFQSTADQQSYSHILYVKTFLCVSINKQTQQKKVREYNFSLPCLQGMYSMDFLQTMWTNFAVVGAALVLSSLIILGLFLKIFRKRHPSDLFIISQFPWINFQASDRTETNQTCFSQQAWDFKARLCL